MRILFIFVLLFVFGSCTKPVRNYLAPQQKVSTTTSIPESSDESYIDTSSTKTTSSSVLPPQQISPAQWPGNFFYVLPKQNLVRSFGYELYSCMFSNCDSVPVDPLWELPNHRIRCENIAGDSLYVESVEPLGNEWLVSFLHTPTGKKIYGKTHKQALLEVVLLSDLSEARSRWLNKTVFAKRGVISIFTNDSRLVLTSLRINIQDSLKVVDVKWGMTPLPVKPVWIMVTSKTGKSGFIPVRYNWTNTMVDRIKRYPPWNEDIFEKNPTALYNWDENTWELVNNHRVILEMTSDQVQLSWGAPLSTTTNDLSEQTLWIYASHELIFIKNKLSNIKERAASK